METKFPEFLRNFMYLKGNNNCLLIQQLLFTFTAFHICGMKISAAAMTHCDLLAAETEPEKSGY
jgi:hypothetical protein